MISCSQQPAARVNSNWPSICSIQASLVDSDLLKVITIYEPNPRVVGLLQTRR